MLSYIRNNAGGKLVWLIVGAIAFVFIFFGIGGGGGPAGQFKVAGHQVSESELRRVWDAVAYDIGQTGADESSLDKAIKAKVVGQLINRHLTLVFAENAGLTPSDISVGRVVAQTPQFQSNGSFDQATYKEVLKSMRMAPSTYENSVRSDLAYGRVGALIGMLSPINPNFAKDFFHFSEDLAAFDYWFFPASKQAEKLSEPDKKQLEIFYEFNKENWRKPATMRIEYVTVSPEDYLEQVEPTEDDFKAAYTENASNFKVPESAEASHILVAFPSENPSAEEKAEALAKAEKLYQRSDKEDFAALAKEASDDANTASGGGSLGTIYKGNNMTVDSKFEESVFSLPLNEVSKPIESESGYHLVKVASRQAGQEKTLDEVKDELAEPIKQRKAKEMAVSKMEAMLKFTDKSADLEAAAKSVGLSTKTSDMFDAQNPPVFMLGDNASIEKAFSATLGRVAPEITRDELMIIYKPLERVESFIPPLAELEEQVREAWKTQEAMKLASKEAVLFIKSSAGQAEENPKSAVVKGQTELAPRMAAFTGETFKELDQQAMLAAVYSVSLPGQVSPTVFAGSFNGEKGYFALALKTLDQVDDSILDQPQGQFALLRMSMDKKAVMMQVWYSGYFKQMESEINVPASLQ